MAWSSSDRRTRLPDNWDALRAECKRLAQGRCQYPVHHPTCDGIGTDCDHIKQGDDHRQANLQWLSGPCHDRKTRLDNDAAMRLMLPRERHPMDELLGR